MSSKLDSPLIKTLRRIRFSSNQNIGEGESNFDDKYVEKVFNWSEVNLSEMTCYKIHTLRNRREIQEVKEKYANEDSKIKTEKCKLCSDSFNNQMDLKRHLEVKHELETITIEKEPHKRFRKDSTETNFDENKRSSKVALDPQLKLAVKTHISKN